MNYNTSGGRCSTTESCNSNFDKHLICSTGNVYDDYFDNENNI